MPNLQEFELDAADEFNRSIAILVKNMKELAVRSPNLKSINLRNVPDLTLNHIKEIQDAHGPSCNIQWQA